MLLLSIVDLCVCEKGEFSAQFSTGNVSRLEEWRISVTQQETGRDGTGEDDRMLFWRKHDVNIHL